MDTDLSTDGAAFVVVRLLLRTLSLLRDRLSFLCSTNQVWWSQPQQLVQLVWSKQKAAPEERRLPR